MFLRIGGRVTAPPRNELIRVRAIAEHEQELWARTSAAGWRDVTEFDDVILDITRVVAAADSVHLLAELDGKPIAAGSLCIHNGVGLLAGASTIPEARKQGAQLALLESRLRHAADSGW